MIIVRFTGGLGNQMFEYAMYMKLKKVFPEENICADLTRYDLIEEHDGFDIVKYFDLQLDIIEDRYLREIAPLIYWAKKIHIKKILKFISCKRIENINEKFEKRNKGIVMIPDYYSTNYNENVFNLNLRNKVIWHYKGNWINLSYWQDIEKEIINVFKFKEDILSEEDRDVIVKMSAEESVAIHIRTGDYVGEHTYDICGSEYYREAILMMKNLCKGKDLKLYIFSESIPRWEFLSELEYTFISHKEKAGIDMWLMSKCKHNIIANSTFSYWSALLNNNCKKNVIAPLYAYRKEVNIEFPVPIQWIQIDNLNILE